MEFPTSTRTRTLSQWAPPSLCCFYDIAPRSLHILRSRNVKCNMYPSWSSLCGCCCCFCRLILFMDKIVELLNTSEPHALFGLYCFDIRRDDFFSFILIKCWRKKVWRIVLRGFY